MDHHALRDAAYAERFRRLWETGRVVTAAGHLGLADDPLEARRRDLWAGQRKPAVPVRPSRARGAGEVAPTTMSLRPRFRRVREG